MGKNNRGKKEKKNAWRELYKSSCNKESVIDKFCAKFAEVVHVKANTQEPEMLRRTIKDWNMRAESIAKIDIEFCEGWKLHKDWFKCMLVQLYIAGSSELKTGFGDRITRIESLMKDLGWDFEQSRCPKYSDVTTIYNVEYRYKTEGIDESKSYRIVLEPTSIFPIGALYISSTEKEWRVIGVDNLHIELEAQEPGKNDSYMIRKFKPAIVHAMTRIV